MDTLTLRPFVDLPPLYPLRLALLGAWRGGRRAWAAARERQRKAAVWQQGLRELYDMNDRMLADIGASRCDIPWFSQRDAFARLLDDQALLERSIGGGARAHRHPLSR
jgi:uncharacterized protein YjiS (DUF1127 family)